MGNEEYIFKGDLRAELLNEEFQMLISNKLKQRSIAKSKRDFNTADTIRDELNKEYNIVINDRNKEWSIDFDNLQEDEIENDEIDPNLTASLDEENEKYTTILDDDLDNTISLDEEEDEEEEQQTDDDDNKKEDIELLNSLT